MAQHQTLTRPFWRMNWFQKSNCPKRIRPKCCAPSLSLTVRVVRPIDMSHQKSQKGGFQRNPGIAVAFKCQPVGIDPFFHNANGSLYAFCLGSCLWNVSPVIASCWTSCKASFNQRLQCCLIVSSYSYRQPSNTNLTEDRCSHLHFTLSCPLHKPQCQTSQCEPSTGLERTKISWQQKGNQQQDCGVFHAYDLLS